MADPDVELAETFGEMARLLLAENGPQATFDRIVRLAVETINDCEHAGISRIKDNKVTTAASSDPVPAIVDDLQSETGEGPCVDAIVEEAVFQTGRLSQEVRWPAFAARASQDSGIESVLAFRLYADGTIGALNLYSSLPNAFDDHDVAIGAVFATHASVALSTSRTIENLQAAVATRELIGEAIGILMARQDISEEEAFAVLKRASQRLNIKLRTIADQIVHPGQTSPDN